LEAMSEEVYNTALILLGKDLEGDTEGLLQRIIEWEESHPQKNEYDGFEWYSVFGDIRTLNKFVSRRVLKVVFKSNKCCMFRATDLEALKRALTDYRKGLTPKGEGIGEIPPDLFNSIIGHKDKKEILFRVLDPSKRHLHALLWGVVASAKTLFLEELSRLPGSKLVLGSTVSKVGLFEVLYNERPAFLIIDELDKVDDPKNLSVLLSLMQTGYISETKHNRDRHARLVDTKVFGSANEIFRFPKELLSRFIPLRFSEYTNDEFTEVVVTLLRDREGLSEPLALHISEKCLTELRTKDVRDAIKIAKLLKKMDKEEIDYIVQILKRQTSPPP